MPPQSGLQSLFGLPDDRIDENCFKIEWSDSVAWSPTDIVQEQSYKSSYCSHQK